MKSFLFIYTLCFSILSFAHQFKCEIYDLAQGSNLAETKTFQVEDSELLEEEPLTIYLEHELIAATFSFSYLDENKKNLVFVIQTEEVENSESQQFVVPILKFPKSRAFELGHVYTEITGIGDNTKSFCSMIRD